MKKNKKGSASLYVTLIISAIFIITLAAVLAPMGVLFNTEMYTAGEDILLRANESMNDIDNAEVRAALQNVTSVAQSTAQDNIEMNANFFRYSWIFVIALAALITFVYTRRVVEFQGGGFV